MIFFINQFLRDIILRDIRGVNYLNLDNEIKYVLIVEYALISSIGFQFRILCFANLINQEEQGDTSYIVPQVGGQGIL